MNNFKYIEFFKPFEFDSPDVAGSGVNMQRSTLIKLDEARRIADMPFKVTSGYRTPQYNELIGGVNSSSHTKGYAVDISAPTSRMKFKIIDAALKAGFNRIGVSSNFVHLDDDPIKVNDVIWTY